MEKIELSTLHVEVITTPKEWRQACNNFPFFDYVHTFDFHAISEENAEGEPVLFAVKASAGNTLLLWPALKKQIGDTGFFDLSSVYGYGGPLFIKGLSGELYAVVFERLFNEMNRLGFVSLFSRMHPLLTHDLPADLQGLALGDVVVIDVHPKQENFLANCRSGHRYEILKAAKSGVDVYVDNELNLLSEFTQIYQQAMRDLGAGNYYLFNDNYFLKFKKIKDSKIILLFAIYEGKKIAASLFFVTQTIMQYYLSGSVAEYKKYAASKMLIAKAHQLAIDLGVREIILGGGLGSQRDALFEFKRGFSRRTEKFCVFRKILNPDVYAKLCRDKGVAEQGQNFFPAYRAPVVKHV